MSIVTELIAFGHRCLTRDEEEFAAAAREGDYGRADAVLDGHASLSEALERQECAGGAGGKVKT